MVALEDYLKNPCGTLSIPYWKAKDLKLPDHMVIMHSKDYVPGKWEQYSSQRFFRISHNLEHIPKFSLEKFTVKITEDVEQIVSIINDSYSDVQVTQAQMLGYRNTPVFCKDLWILVREKATGEAAGCAMADFDPETKELAIEWVQVLPKWRNRGIGKYMVTELLGRGKPYAAFATVSGQVDNKTNPERLYRKCGFTGEDIWYILRKK